VRFIDAMPFLKRDGEQFFKASIIPSLDIHENVRGWTTSLACEHSWTTRWICQISASSEISLQKKSTSLADRREVKAAREFIQNTIQFGLIEAPQTTIPLYFVDLELRR
jgi:hypothetical protein